MLKLVKSRLHLFFLFILLLSSISFLHSNAIFLDEDDNSINPSIIGYTGFSESLFETIDQLDYFGVRFSANIESIEFIGQFINYNELSYRKNTLSAGTYLHIKNFNSIQNFNLKFGGELDYEFSNYDTKFLKLNLHLGNYYKFNDIVLSNGIQFDYMKSLDNYIDYYRQTLKLNLGVGYKLDNLFLNSNLALQLYNKSVIDGSSYTNNDIYYQLRFEIGYLLKL